MSVARAQREMSSAEFTEWQAFAELEPFGDQRGDLRIGYAMARLASMFTARGAKPLCAKDFMPQFERPRARKQSQEYIASVIGTVLTAMQGKKTNG